MRVPQALVVDMGLASQLSSDGSTVWRRHGPRARPFDTTTGKNGASRHHLKPSSDVLSYDSILFYGAIAMILRQAKNEGGLTVSHQIVHTFVSQLIPSGGGAIGKRLC
jgi:hypothetical protein